jgi:hypothetical protein
VPTVTVGQENSADIEIHYSDHCVGQTVVLIRGYSLSGRAWGGTAFLERLVHADFSTCGKLCTHRNTIAALLALWFCQRTVADSAAAFRRNRGAMGAPELEEQRVSLASAP